MVRAAVSDIRRINPPQKCKQVSDTVVISYQHAPDMRAHKSDKPDDACKCQAGRGSKGGDEKPFIRRPFTLTPRFFATSSPAESVFRSQARDSR